MDVLVVGARKGSLGDAVLQELTFEASAMYDVKTAGVAGDEDYFCDVRRLTDCEALVQAENWQHIICTVGINKADDIFKQTFNMHMVEQMWTNYVGPMNMLNAWMNRHGPGDHGKGTHQFVAISSNSAHVPRSTSVGYCASKAALSQAIRCAARSLPQDVVAWALEPGWITATPMSQEVHERMQGVRMQDVPHMRGGNECNMHDLARFIRLALESSAPRAYNGMTITLDGGER